MSLTPLDPYKNDSHLTDYIDVTKKKRNVTPQDRSNKKVAQVGISLKDSDSGLKAGRKFKAKVREREITETLSNLTLKEDETKLDAYGNKHKNLIKQHRLVKSLNLPGIIVPKPRGITHEQIHTFLDKNAEEIFSTHWNALKTLHNAYKGNIPFLESPEAKEHLQAIDAAIIKAFSRDDAFNTLDLPPKFTDWLQAMSNNGNYLMVRSTGAEDSGKAANAGGNTSVSYVPPKEQALCHALGEVVRSYFSYASLQNRIHAGENPFEEELKLAVTVQELIGESLDGETKPEDIPRSLVLFTNEPLYIGDEKFRVMRLSGTYGHGEAVVGNQGVSTDTILILHSEAHPDKLYILYDNQEKKTRLAPIRDPNTGEINLQKVKNPPSLVKERVFDKAMIQRLYEWGIIGETYFQGATDMEIVVKGDTIYPVQARPIIRPSQLPTYIDLKKLEENHLSPIESSRQMTMIVPGKSSVLKIESANQVLVAKSLTEVQEKQLFKKDQHKLVIVLQEEPANSHPVINFSGYGIPCLCAQDGVEELIKKLDPNHHLAVCVQSATVHLWNHAVAPIDTYTSKGYVVHPAKIAVSTSLTKPLQAKRGSKSEVPQEVKDLIFKVRTANTSEIALKYLKELKNHGWIAALTARKEELEKKTTETPLAKRSITPLIKGAGKLEKAVDKAFGNLEAVLKQNKGDKRLQMLFFAKVLETLLFNNEENKGAVGQYSVVTMGSHMAAAEEQIAYQRELSHEAQFMHELMYGMECPIPEMFDQWRTFLLDLERELNAIGELEGNLVQDLKKMLHTMHELGATPWFMTLSFPQTLSSDPITTAKNLLSLMPKEAESLINDVLERKASLQAMRQQLDTFGDPTTFEQAFKSLQKETDAFIAKDQNEGGTPLQHALKSSNWSGQSPIVKQLIIETTNDLVDLYDSAIKTMKKGVENDKEKTKKFNTMIGPYFGLLESLAKKTVPSDSFPMFMDWSLNRYLETISEKYEDMSAQNTANLKPSKNFSVSAAMLGSATNFKRHYPETLEDIFTLTHQNLLASTSALSNQCISNEELTKSPFPQQFKDVINKVNKIGGNRVGSPQRIGIKVKADRVILHYNVPLRNHSGMFSLEYEPGDGQVVAMHSQFLGQARERWTRAANFVELLGKILNSSCTPKVTENELSYSIKIRMKDAIENILQIYQNIAVYSIEQNPESLDVFFENLIFTDYTSLGNTLKDILQSPNSNNNIKEWTIRLFEFLVINGHAYESAEESAEIGVQDPNRLIQQRSSRLFGELVIKNQAYKAAEKATEKLIENDSPYAAVELYKELIKKGQACDSAITAAEKLMENNNLDMAVNLYVELVKSGQAYEPVVKTAEKLMENNNLDMAVNLYVELIKSSQTYEPAVKAAEKLMQNNNLNMALKIYLELVESGQAYEPAIKAAELNINRGSNELDLYKVLFDKKQGFESALKTAEKLMKNDNLDMALKLYLELVKSGQAYEPAIKAAELNINRGRNELDLYKVLFDKKQGFESALKNAEMLMKNNKLDMALNLYLELVKSGQAYEPAIKAAEIAIQNNDPSIRWLGIVIFKELVVKDEAYEPAIKAVEIVIMGPENLAHNENIVNFPIGSPFHQFYQNQLNEFKKAIKNNAYELLKELVIKNQAYKVAIKAADLALSDDENEVKEKGEELKKILLEKGISI